jgi:uncharacterized membrane protein YsdA (DUF1294 family)/cold shock CspA family protein
MPSSQRETGVVTVWNDDRGFGFVRRADGSELFLHIKAFPRDSPIPEVGDAVTYKVEARSDGRLRAAQARPASERYVAPIRPTPPILGAVAILAFVAIYLLVEENWGPVPPWVLVLYLGVSAITFAIYASDKSAARLKRPRVRETSLILLGLLGGWPGAIIGQQVFRHKTVKLSFRAVFWLSVFMNVVAFVALNAPGVARTVSDTFFPS